MKYTKDQEDALVNMVEWSVTEPETAMDYLYTLDGAAGTGKTTIIKEFLKRLKIPKSRIAVTAPTHQAKKQIERATGYKGQTIQKILGLRPNMQMEKFDINDPTFKVLGEVLMKLFKIIIIDEGSMLNASSFKLISTQAKQYKVKIIFLGDSYQLPPVGENLSKVFSTVKNKSTLTTVVRQGDDNPMAPILQLLRRDIDNGTSNGILELTGNKSIVLGNKGFKCLAKKPDEVFGKTTFGVEMMKKFMSTEYSIDKNYMKFIAYTNDTVVTWSNVLRTRLLGEEAAENVINKGEILTGYTPITDYATGTVIIGNSEDYVVESTAYMISEEGIKGFSVRLLNEKKQYRTVFIVDHLDEESFDLFRHKAVKLLQTATVKRGYAWKKWYQFKHAHLTLVEVLKNPDLPKSKSNLLCKKDLYYGYGVTVHKSQGSTFTNVAINLIDLYTNHKENERARLIYVALSRCTDMNLILVK